MPKTNLIPPPESGPVYLRLAGVLEGMIQSQSLRPGDRVPSVRQFGRQQKVSVPTALNAYAALETRGLIEARPKSGYFVRRRQADAVRTPGWGRPAPRITDFSSLDPLDTIMSDHGDPAFVPLGAALPSPELLPGEKLARIMGAIARRIPGAGVAYDVMPGSEILRRELARRSLDWGCALQPDEFMVTNGCTEALALALRATCQPGDTVVVESPTYFGLSSVLRESRLKALPIPVDSETGIDLEMLATALRKTRVAACLLIPNFHNPTGFLMPEERKKALMELVGPRGIPIIEDDTYGDLQHQGTRPRCLKAFDRNGSVILCGSFSKTLAPGYRIGYISGGRWHAQLMRLKQISSLANATLPTLAVAEFLKHGGYDRHLRSLRHAYRSQMEHMREAVAASFPPGIGLSRPQGNLVLWCELPARVDSIELFQRARAAGISVAPGPLFAPDGGCRNFIRLNCGHPWSPLIERSVAVLGHLATELANKG
ncbi:MAG: PLP-dependent aminotransferase family protein [Verrucomicrobiaceae bacterium]|nr:MAG: PLP-dependent aminotransferase family protein [Verrucomicrobiaceae bacterium]